jgi:hypothetical protein
MSKAVAWIHPDHLDNADMDILVKFMANSKRTESCSAPLYTTDHAEELAKALRGLVDTARHLDEIIHGDRGCGEVFIEDEMITKAVKALTNYREATK